ncbi:MAG: hypothetical protein JOZ90_13340 [Alphaproteobacteria bacterium]|nr:hypothetical protein [Alphaproteobacteria bacterium]MBV9372867.1 hypothetical protein [Alphaproteobacteria bacterium]MBV9902055.1 hypothetical protein [Alphaproteobacteria bacterium]
MPDKPPWMDWADLAAKLAVPVVLFVATLQFNDRQARAHAAENCLDLQIRLFSLGCADRACTVTEDRATTLIGFDRLISGRCRQAGIAPVTQTRQVLATASAQVTDAKLSADLQQAAGAPRPKAARPIAGPLPLAPQTRTASSLEQAPGLRVYVQITAEGQRDSARALIERLSRSTVGGARLAAEGPELVPGYRLRNTELRCLKKADCARASDLAAYIGVQLGTAVTVRDLSARYETSPRVKSGNYELWFASTLQAAAPAAAPGGVAAGG